MPRLRVFEVAQQINKTNKEVLDYLKENNVNVKSHMSTLEEKDEKMVRNALGAKGDKNEENKGADKKMVKKKSNLIGVFRPQNAQTQEGKNFRKKPAQGGQNRSQGQNRPQNTKSAAPRTEKPAQEVSQKTTSVQNPVNNQEAAPQATSATMNRPVNTALQNQDTNRRYNNNRPNQDRREGQERREGAVRKFDNNKFAQGGQGRPQRQDRPARPDRPEGRDNRKFGERPNGNQEGRKFDKDRNGMNREFKDRDGKDKDKDYRDNSRENNRRNDRRDSKPSVDMRRFNH